MYFFWQLPWPLGHPFYWPDLGNGFGLFLDLGQLKPVNDDTGKENQTSKIIGDQIEYQLSLGESFSFSLFGAEFRGKCALPDNT